MNRGPEMDTPRLRTTLRRLFTTGLISLLPTVAVLYILFFVIGKLNRAADWLINRLDIEPGWWSDFVFPAVFFFLSLSTVIAVGVISTTLVGRGAARVWEWVIRRIPILRGVYGAVRQISTALTLRKKNVFKGVVLVQYPQTGLRQIGFVTDTGIKDLEEGVELMSIFLPSTPNPTTGFLFLTTSEHVTFLDISAEEALKMILSGGILNPTHTRYAATARAPNTRPATASDSSPTELAPKTQPTTETP
ncbi:MAG: DUF502 domain-containing protein [Candidatus Poribacteria bacterium]